MATVLALPLLFEAVVAVFAADTTPPTPVTQAFGWREPSKQAGERRIVWVPGDDGELGEVGPARNPGRNPRPLATVRELFTVYLEALDLTAPENELAQYTAARLLFDRWLRAVYVSAHGTFEIRSVAWVTDKQVRRHGATIRVVATIEAMVPDLELEVAPADAYAEVTTHIEPVDTEGETDTVFPPE